MKDTGSYAPPWNTTTKVVVVVLLLALAGLAFSAFRIVLTPLIIGGIIAYLFQPVVRWISQATRLPRSLATAILYLILLALTVPILIALMPVVVNQIVYLKDEVIRFLRYLNTLSASAAVIEIGGFEIAADKLVGEITGALVEMVRSVATESPRLVFDVAELLLLVIFTFLVGFYLTADAEKFIALMRGLAPPAYRRDLGELLSEIDHVWSAFFRGQLILALVVGTLVTIASSIIGLPQPALMGALAGLMEFLPSVGHAIWVTTAVIVALLEGSTTLPISNFAFALVVVGFYVAYTQFDLNFLIPRIIGGHVHLHPLVVILGIIVGAKIGGVLGIALAAPTIASLRIIGRYVYAKLLDLPPFPMVGPPVAPVHERQAEAERRAAELPPPLPKPGVVVKQVVHRRKSGGRRDSGQNPQLSK